MRTYTFAAAVAAVAAGVVAIPSPVHAADTNPPILLSTVPGATWNGWYPEDTPIQVGATELGFPVPAGLQSVSYTLTGSQSGSGSFPIAANGISSQGEVTISPATGQLSGKVR